MNQWMHGWPNGQKIERWRMRRMRRYGEMDGLTDGYLNAPANRSDRFRFCRQ